MQITICKILIITENLWSLSNLTLDKSSDLIISSLALLISGVKYCLEKTKLRNIVLKPKIIKKSFSKTEIIIPIKVTMIPNK